MNDPNLSAAHTNVALLVHSCDRYELLYKGFEYFFLKYWKYSVNCNHYFATEEKEANIQSFKTIRSGKGEWSDRLALLLREKIEEQYVLYFQEDMWLNKQVNARFFNQLFDTAQQNSWQQVKLHSSEVYKTIATSKYIEGFNVSKLDNLASSFLMSHQITLWNKEFLLKQLYAKEHPWRNERRANKRLKNLNPEIFQIDYFAENGNKEINTNINPVLRSEYHTISVNGTLNSNVEPYLRELKNGGTEYAEYASKLEHNYLHQITHDGKAKPRKTDVFKRFKNWMRGK